MSNLISNVANWIPMNPFVAPPTITVSNGFPVTLSLEVQEYTPHNTSALIHVIWRGMEAGTIPPQVQSSPFGLNPRRYDVRIIDSYLDEMVPHLIESVAKESPQLIRVILLRAYSQSQRDDWIEGAAGNLLIKVSLRLWAAQTIFFKSHWRIDSGAEVVQMAPLDIPGYWNGVTLLPRLINQQLDALFEQRMADLEKEILYHLQVAMHKNRRDLWFSIFLSTFLVLHSLEKDSWNLHAWMSEVRRDGGASWPLETKPEVYNDQNTHLAHLLCAHYKSICKGSTPLTLDWTRPSTKKIVHNDELTAQFLQGISELINKQELQRLKAQGDARFTREDNSSLDLLFTSKLLID